MAGWISSKLKVAETLLQQIDQQAAESLRKNERPPSPSDAASDSIPKKIDPSPPLKYQLPKKSSTPPPPQPPAVARRSKHDPDSGVRPPGNPPASSTSTTTINPDPAIDWTELLSSPKPISHASHLKAGRKKPPVISAPALEKKESREGPTNSTPKPKPGGRADIVGGESTESSAALSGVVESSSPSQGRETDEAQIGKQPDLEDYREKVGSGAGARRDDDRATADETGEQPEGRGNRSGVESAGVHNDESSGSSSGSYDSESDSASASDSEDERQRREERRKRRERMIAEKAAAAAVKAIKEREDTVARLEGEKQSLEKILEEREKQQAQEASELQMSMIETMEAVELEKQKHNSTRMEALASLAKLETTNAELARLFATTQWNLEVEVNRVSELRQQIEFKELAKEEHKRRMLKISQRSSSPNEEDSLRRSELEQEILDAEYSLICNKISKLKDKAKKLQENIEMIREIVHPTEVEVELKKRLAQLTDHLIQKQTQVEALSSEKATLVLRMETVSRLLDENGLSSDEGLAASSSGTSFDIEAGTWQHKRPSNSVLIRERIRSGKQHLGSVLQQLDSIFSAGAIFLRRNPMAQLWSMLYLLCLHLWVMYILMSSHSNVASDGAGNHGAVFSLENINNKTSGS